MAINFPASPTPNDTHTAGGVTYKWDGTSWLAQGVTGLYTLPTASDTVLGGVKVGHNLDINGTDALSVSEPFMYEQVTGTASNPIVLTVRYAAKTANNQTYGTGASDCFYINDVEAPALTLVVGKYYKFDQSDASNTGHELALFNRENKTHPQYNGVVADDTFWMGRDMTDPNQQYGNFVTFTGTAGQAGAFTTIQVHPRCNSYYYYESNNTSVTHTGNVIDMIGTHGTSTHEQTWVDGWTLFQGAITSWDQFTNGGIFMSEVNNNSSTYSVTKITVKVRAKTASNQYNGQGNANTFEMHRTSENEEDDLFLEAPFLHLIPGNRYRFLQDDVTNTGYRLMFYTSKDATTSNQIQDGSHSYVGTPGQAGAYTEIEIRDTTPGLLYYMVVGTGLEYMGGMASCGTATGTGSGGGGTPGGSDSQFQYNSNGSLGGTSSLILTGGSDLQFTGDNFNCTWNKTLSSFAYADGAKAIFGSNTDLSIFHASNLNEIKGGNATPLKISVDDFTIANEAGNANLIKATSADVSLYHSGNAKVTTTASGATITGTLTAGGLIYPSTDGATGEFLQTDGSGNLSWQSAGNSAISINSLTDVDIQSNAPQNNQVLKWNGTNWVPADDLTGGSGGSGLTSRSTSSAATSGSHSTGSSEDITIGSVAKTYSLLKIQSSHAAWITLYTDTTARTNDSTRTEYTDPLPGTGVIAEVITTDGQGQLITPAVIGFNNDASPTDNVYAKVVNKSGATRPITVTLTFVKLEA